MRATASNGVHNHRVNALLLYLVAGQMPRPLHFRPPAIRYPLAALADAVFEVRKASEATVTAQIARKEHLTPAGTRHWELIVQEPGKAPATVLFGATWSDTFERYWGNPNQPPFVIESRHPRHIQWDIFLPGWLWHPRSYSYIHLVGKDSVIAGVTLSTLCRAKTDGGVIIWERDFGLSIDDVTATEEGIWTTLGDGRRRLLAWSDGRTIKRKLR